MGLLARQASKLLLVAREEVARPPLALAVLAVLQSLAVAVAALVAVRTRLQRTTLPAWGGNRARPNLMQLSRGLQAVMPLSAFVGREVLGAYPPQQPQRPEILAASPVEEPVVAVLQIALSQAQQALVAQEAVALSS